MKYFKPEFNSEISAPASKSEAIRIFLCAALSLKPCKVYMSGSCSDIETALSAIPVFGARVERNGESLTVIPAETFPQHQPFFPNFKDCGTALRLYLPVMQTIWKDVRYKASERLTERIRGTLLSSDEINSHVTSVDASLSSQTLSGLIFAKALTGGSIRICGPVVSRPYVNLSLNILSEFSGRPYKSVSDIGATAYGRFSGVNSYTVESDWSGAAFLLVAAAIGSRKITVRGLNPESVQGDKIVVEVLRRAGADITVGRGNVTCRPSVLLPFDFDSNDYPDLVPALAAAAAATGGKCKFYNVDRLKTKESDRVASLIEMINGAGGKAAFHDGTLTVCGPVRGGVLRSSPDHRITMAQIILSLISEQPIEIDDVSSVEKSFPGFCDTFKIGRS